MDAEKNSRLPTASVPSRQPVLFPLLTAIVAMLAFVTIPSAPTDLDTDADTSLSAVMNYGQDHGLHLGAELVHTYGPLGHLIFFYFSPQCATLRMLTDVIFCYAVAAGLCLLVWRLGWPWRCAVLGIFIFLAANIHPRTDLVIDAGSFSWGLLCCVESGRRLKASALIFTMLAIWAALAKNSFLFTSGFSLTLIALLMALRGNWRLGIAMVAGFIAGVGTGWLAIEHRIADIPGSAVNALSVIHAYNQAMAWEALRVPLATALLVLALALPMILLRSANAFAFEPRHRTTLRALLFLWLSALLFFDWKHGFVRGDVWHVGYFFGFIPVLALALEIFPARTRVSLKWARALAIACCLFSILALQLTYFPTPAKSFVVPLQAFCHHVRDLSMPGNYVRRMNDANEANRKKADLPELRRIIGNASVDVFGQMQVYALLNGLNLRPRPVFQSYVACNARLMRLNEEFYLSTNAPDYLMFRLAPIDRRFPALEDAILLRDLLFNFELVTGEEPFVLLKPKSFSAPRLVPLREGEVRPGEILSLTDYSSTNLWLELDVKPTVAGRLRELLFHAPTVRLAAWRDGKSLLLKRRAPPVMLAAGFLASPFITTGQDLVNFYKGGPIVRPAGYSIELLPGEEWFWQNNIHFRLYKIEKPPRSL